MPSWWGGSLKCAAAFLPLLAMRWTCTHTALQLRSCALACAYKHPVCKLLLRSPAGTGSGNAHLGCEPCNEPAFTLLCGLQSSLPWPVLLEDRPVSL